MRDNIDFRAKFYVRLEDGGSGLWIWDEAKWDTSLWDIGKTLLARLIASNNRRLKGLE